VAHTARRAHTRYTHHTRWSPRRKRGLAALVSLALLLPLLGYLWHLANVGTSTTTAAHQAGGLSVYAPATQHVALPHQRVYFVERHPEGYMLMSSDVAGAEAPVSSLPDHFGAEDTDVVAALQLSPDQRYLAIDAQRDHGDTVWIVATQTAKLSTMPADATGNFLHWLPDGDHFLFRPVFPVGPSDTTWHPGLWIVNAADGNHVDLPLPNGMDATDVIDAAPSPDGTKIMLSTTMGLGTGSTVWQTTPNGAAMQPLFTSADDAGLFAWSPDGKQVGYETIADSTVPFRPAGLWLMSAATTERHQIGVADGGHGFAPVWSPNGQHLAFVTRLNAGDGSADSHAGALVSGVSTYTPATRLLSAVATPDLTGQPRNVNPTWRSDGALLFTAMSADAGYGAALGEAALWSASSAGAPASHLAPTGSNFLADASPIVAIVP
jgi:Tol biopolymer transport system component